jgi:hypothetical protein
MCVRRAHEHGDRLARLRRVVDKAATAAEQGVVLDARKLFGLQALIHGNRFGREAGLRR